MTAIGDWVDISAGHSVPGSLATQNLIGFRACLGTSFVDSDFSSQFADARRTNPDAVTLDYIFLSGPKRKQPIASQIAFYKSTHRAELSCLDWEDDDYIFRGVSYHMGRQTFPSVLAGVKEAQRIGLDPGVYASKSLLTQSVVAALILAGVPFIWIAGYGVSIPQWLIDACKKADVLLFHQYQGFPIDRSLTLVGTLEQLHELAGRPPLPAPAAGEPMTNLTPLTAHRVLDLPAGKVLEKTPGGEPYTTLQDPVTLGLLGATATHYHVADGDAGVYVLRTGLIPRAGEINAGA